MKTIYLFAFGCLISIFACKSASSDEAIAREICDCLQPMVELYEKMEADAANSESDAVIEAMEDLERLAAESQECSDQLMKKYPDLGAREAQVEAAMEKACPNVVRMLTEYSD